MDRALCNDQWRLLYPEATVHHLPRTCSDHSPLLLQLHWSVPPPNKRPFCFQAAWLTHEEFPEVIQGAWSSHSHSIVEAIQAVEMASREFNEKVFRESF